MCFIKQLLGTQQKCSMYNPAGISRWEDSPPPSVFFGDFGGLQFGTQARNLLNVSRARVCVEVSSELRSELDKFYITRSSDGSVVFL